MITRLLRAIMFIIYAPVAVVCIGVCGLLIGTTILPLIRYIYTGIFSCGEMSGIVLNLFVTVIPKFILNTEC